MTLSPTKQGFSEPSTSRVKRVTTCHQPPPETTSALARTLLSTGTGAGKRILLTLHQLFGPIAVPREGRRGCNNVQAMKSHAQATSPKKVAPKRELKSGLPGTPEEQRQKLRAAMKKHDKTLRRLAE